MDDCNIVLYALSTCIHCKNTKEFLSQCGVKYQCINVDLLEPEEKKSILEEIRKVNPSCAFPTLLIGDKVIIGYRDDLIKEALGLN